MKKYEIEFDNSVSMFFEEIAIVVQRPIEEILVSYQKTMIQCEW